MAADDFSLMFNPGYILKSFMYHDTVRNEVRKLSLECMINQPEIAALAMTVDRAMAAFQGMTA